MVKYQSKRAKAKQRLITFELHPRIASLERDGKMENPHLEREDFPTAMAAFHWCSQGSILQAIPIVPVCVKERNSKAFICKLKLQTCDYCVYEIRLVVLTQNLTSPPTLEEN